MIGQASSGFPRLARLRAAADYQAVFGDGKRFSSPCFRLHVQVRPVPALARLGIAVSKRVDKLSPGRNRIKRVVREYFRQQRSGLAGADFVVVAKPPAATASNQTLRSELELVFKRAHALPPAEPAGTMPALEATDDRRHSIFPDPS